MGATALFTSLILGALLLGACASNSASMREEGQPAADPQQPAADPQWRAVHFFAPWHSEVPLLKRTIEEKLAPMGINMIVLEVNYKFDYKSHPELREAGDNLTREDARELAEVCRANGIRLVPLFMCLGHQSWAQTTFPLLTEYPELDETPDVPANNDGIYCRSWCPNHPKTNEIVFALMEELIEAFDADAFHVGLDEVFLIASDQCPRCRGKDPAEVFAKATNDYYDFLVKKHGLEMMMWGDRLLDCAYSTGNKGWECAENGTAPAIDMIPKDIMIFDWHYEGTSTFPSVLYFQAKGFRVMPATWRDIESTKAFMQYAHGSPGENLAGHVFCTWVGLPDVLPALLGELPKDRELPQEGIQAAASLQAGMQFLNSGQWPEAK